MNCRSCGSNSFGEVIDLGMMPLVNNLLDRPDQHVQKHPLHVVFCRTCSLAQLTDSPPPSAMFDNYLYYSSQSQTMVRHAAGLVAQHVQTGDRVLEIASNDGYLLRHAQQRGAAVLGIDPARNICEYAVAQGVPTWCAYFNPTTAERIRSDWGPADVIFANNVLAHVPDPNELVAGLAIALNDHGIAHIEVPYILPMIDSCAFDTIYHEHHSYFSKTSLKPLFNRHGLRVIDVTVAAIHGGSLHLQVAHEGDESAAEEMIDAEALTGVLEDRYYCDFAERVWALKSHLEAAMDEHGEVVAYGAAAKGVVLLNTFVLKAERIQWVADVSPHKQGKYIPGTLQPIVSPAELLCQQPTAALLLPWNIKQEVVRRNMEYLNQGGRFIVPIPTVHTIDRHAAAELCHA